ncbi:MAG: OmpH family outer membrane protein [Chitinophagaceae bacterium]|jgi:outer membrane protein
MERQKSDRIILYSISLIVIAMAGIMVKGKIQKPAVAYIDISKMVEGYKFKKDMEAEGTKNLYHIKNTVDSLKLVQKMGSNQLVDSQVMYAERAFEQYYTYSNQEMTKKIWERLNPLLEEFGKERNYELIIGANGAGSLLYGSKKNDVTDEAIVFINKKYEKGN